VRASYRCDATDVVVVGMGERHEVEPPHALTPKRGTERRRARSRVDQGRVAAVAHEHRVALPHIEHHDLGALPGGRSGDESRHRK